MTILGHTPGTLREVAIQRLSMYGSEVNETNIQKVIANLSKVETSVTVEGKHYKVSNAAYYLPKTLQLPDGRQARLTGGWLESMPPQGFAEVITDSLFPDTDVYEAVEA